MKHIKTLTLAAALLFGGLALANPMHQQKGGKNFLRAALHKLDLNELQRQQVKQIMKSSKGERRNLVNQLAEGKSKMIALVDTDKPDQATIEAAATEQSQLMRQLILHKADLFSQIRAVLNDEQRVKLSKMREKREKIRGIMLEEI